MNEVIVAIKQEIAFKEAVLALYEEGGKEQFEAELAGLQKWLEREEAHMRHRLSQDRQARLETEAQGASQLRTTHTQVEEEPARSPREGSAIKQVKHTSELDDRMLDEGGEVDEFGEPIDAQSEVDREQSAMDKVKMLGAA